LSTYDFFLFFVLAFVELSLEDNTIKKMNN
jgi:hypothetical protein